MKELEILRKLHQGTHNCWTLKNFSLLEVSQPSPAFPPKQNVGGGNGGGCGTFGGAGKTGAGGAAGMKGLQFFGGTIGKIVLGGSVLGTKGGGIPVAAVADEAPPRESVWQIY